MEDHEIRLIDEAGQEWRLTHESGRDLTLNEANLIRLVMDAGFHPNSPGVAECFFDCLLAEVGVIGYHTN